MHHDQGVRLEDAIGCAGILIEKENNQGGLTIEEAGQIAANGKVLATRHSLKRQARRNFSRSSSKELRFSKSLFALDRARRRKATLTKEKKQLVYNDVDSVGSESSRFSEISNRE